MPKRTCSIDGCEKPSRGHGLCTAHYKRWYRHGDPLGGAPSPTPRGALPAFFETNVVRETDECIIWPFTLSSGYGQFVLRGRKFLVHRLALERTSGSAPNEASLACHSCRNRACFNPRHLSWGTTLTNLGEDRRRDGTLPTGERNPRSVLTEADVHSIRSRYDQDETVGAIASGYPVCYQTGWKAARGLSWTAL